MRWVLAILAVAACGRSEPAPRAIDAGAVTARAYLEATVEPRAELPDLAYRPAHDDLRYLEGVTNTHVTRLYIEPLDERMIAARVQQMQVDFRELLGREISGDELARWQAAMLEDMRRRRLAVRALLDLAIAGELAPDELDARLQAIHGGIELSFRRITQLSSEEHDRLSGR